MADAIHADGYCIVPGVLEPARVASLLDALQRCDVTGSVARRGERYAMRNLLDAVPAVRELCEAPAVRAIVEAVLGPGAFCVRGILFDKVPAANWHVGWHQDRAIAVAARADVPGFGPWSVKAGVVHVEPPVALLERMLVLRMHLDDCSGDAGPLRVIPGSHREGRLTVEEIHRWTASRDAVACIARAGDVLVMRPLLLHASSPARWAEDVPAERRHRRVIHLEFAAESLPDGLAWHSRAGQGVR